MRTRSAGSAVPLLRGAILAGLLAGLLAGCAAMPAPAPSPSATVTAAAPLFASDAEALAAAEAAYAAYLAVSDEVLAGGGESTASLHDVAEGQALEYELEGASDFNAGGLWATGTTSFTTYRLQSVQASQRWAAEVAMYVCDDLSKVDLIDASGQSQALPDRPVHIPFVVTVVGNESSAMKVSGKRLWLDANYCV